MMIDALGCTPIDPPAGRARYSLRHVGSEYIGLLCFQTVLSDLVQTNPDMFD